MLIEDYWNDGIEYYIEFEVTNGRVIRKNIIVPGVFGIEQVKKLIINRFNHVKKIICVEEIQEVLLMKDYSKYYYLKKV